jgi:DNA-binding NtrC family response regulator
LKAGRPTIALIEDDPMVRTALAEAIDRASFNVIAAASGPEGLAVLDDHARTIDVAIIDIRLPGRLDGIAVAREAKRQNPNLRVIFTSGAPPHVELGDLGEFMAKPARIPTVLETIARLLGLEEKAPPERG